MRREGCVWLRAQKETSVRFKVSLVFVSSSTSETLALKKRSFFSDAVRIQTELEPEQAGPLTAEGSSELTEI